MPVRRAVEDARPAPRRAFPSSLPTRSSRPPSEMRARQAQYASARETREEEEEDEDEATTTPASLAATSPTWAAPSLLPAYASARRVHGLRGAPPACVHPLTGTASPNAVIMRVLGHANIEESLAYSLVRVRFRQWPAGRWEVAS